MVSSAMGDPLLIQAHVATKEADLAFGAAPLAPNHARNRGHVEHHRLANATAHLLHATPGPRSSIRTIRAVPGRLRLVRPDRAAPVARGYCLRMERPGGAPQDRLTSRCPCGWR